jgi:putative lipoprotein
MRTRVRPDIIAVVALTVTLRLPIVIDGWLGADKIKHFMVSMVVQSFTYSTAQAAGMERGDAMRASLAITAVAGLGREIYDGKVKGRFSVSDLVWDAGGMVAATEMLKRTR